MTAVVINLFQVKPKTLHLWLESLWQIKGETGRRQ